MKKLTSIEVSGSLLSEALLQTLSEETTRNKFAQPGSFRWYKYDVLDTKALHEMRISDAYETLMSRWDMYTDDFLEFTISDLRDKWLRFFFRQFGFDIQYNKADVQAGELRFPLSHNGWDSPEAPMIHTVLFQQDLDGKVNDGRHKYSPHDTLQRYLINTDKCKWGIVTNGRYLRLLRDFHHETRKAFIQFDLEMIFQSRKFDDFRLLYRLIHPSRFLPTEDNEDIVLEQLFAESKAAGVAIGEDLRANIKLAIEELANGFLASTPDLTGKMVNSQTDCDEFHHQILRVIYRILFLLYAEQRNLMPSASSLYFQEYSITELREKIETGFLPEDVFTDLWEGLKATFNMVFKGVPELNIPNYNGLLFSPEEIKLLNSCKCRNDNLLKMIRYMTTVEKNGILQRISYIELGVEEIGSIYESLLEYIPRVSDKPESFEDMMLVGGKHKKAERSIAARTFFLDPRGTNRKTSGSYYTDKGLVNALIESALVPVLEDRLKEAGPNNDLQAEALLDLKLCDPACGSGAFLIAATEYLGLRLARIRANDDYPSDTIVRHSRRDVLRHCIYGVDLNPLAVELCKVSLWLTAATDDQPLNFLDHHLKCGNSLIGATPELIEKGIPIGAYQPVIGDDKTVCSTRKKIARTYEKQQEEEKHQQTFGFEKNIETMLIEHPVDFSTIHSEDSADDIELLKQEYDKYRQQQEFKRKKMIADYWTAAFFWKHTNPDLADGQRPPQWSQVNEMSSRAESRDALSQSQYPNSETLDFLLNNPNYDLPKKIKKQIEHLAAEYRFFHWHLEFSEVFAREGFDCMLGNPPWDRIKLQEKEFFTVHDEEIANAPNKASRVTKINKLKTDNPKLWNKFNHAKRDSEATSKFMRFSERYPLTARGDINLYPIFAETFKNQINEHGHAGLIVPPGISTDDYNKTFFQYLINNRNLHSLYAFVNEKMLFPSVLHNFKFCLLTITGNSKKIFNPDFANEIQLLDDLRFSFRHFYISKDDINLINPNSKTSPVFFTKLDAELTKKIYRQVTVLINEENDENPWKISFKRMFDMSNDSNHFHAEIAEDRIPLYEAKMFYSFDHRYGSYDYETDGRLHMLPKTKPCDYENKHFFVTSSYYVYRNIVDERVKDLWMYKWFLTFRGIASRALEKTFVSSILPYSGISNSAPVIIPKIEDISDVLLLFSNLNMLIFDYQTKQKISGANLNFFIVKQLPILPPDFYSAEDISFIKPRVLELVYTAYDLKPFAEDMGYTGEPFKWDEERRANLKAELDAYYAKLYGLNRKQLRYILDPADLTPRELEDILDPWEEVKDPLIESEYKKRCEQSTFPGETFRVLKEKEIRNYGEYRTRRLVLEKWDEMFGEEE